MKAKLLKKIRKEIYLEFYPSRNEWKAITPKDYDFDYSCGYSPKKTSPLNVLETKDMFLEFLWQNRLNYARLMFSKYSKKIIVR